MADFTALKTAIQTYIKQNGNEEITGNILQEVLLAMVQTMGDGAINDLVTALSNEATERQNADGTLQNNITAEALARGNADTALGGRLTTVEGAITAINTKLSEGYVYAGIATPSTNPITPTGKVFYIATAAGTYTNFLDGSSQALILTSGINILKFNGTAWSQEKVWDIDDVPTKDSNVPVKSGGVFDVLIQDVGVGTIEIGDATTRNAGGGSQSVGLLVPYDGYIKTLKVNVATANTAILEVYDTDKTTLLNTHNILLSSGVNTLDLSSMDIKVKQGYIVALTSTIYYNSTTLDEIFYQWSNNGWVLRPSGKIRFQLAYVIESNQVKENTESIEVIDEILSIGEEISIGDGRTRSAGGGGQYMGLLSPVNGKIKTVRCNVAAAGNITLETFSPDRSTLIYTETINVNAGVNLIELSNKPIIAQGGIIAIDGKIYYNSTLEDQIFYQYVNNKWSLRTDKARFECLVTVEEMDAVSELNLELSSLKEEVGEVIRVGSSRVITKLKDALDIALLKKNSRIILDSETFDLISEFGADYWNQEFSAQVGHRGIELYNGIVIEGTGNSVVKCHYEGANPTVNEWFSIFNSNGSFTLKNIILDGKNIRYCVHDEMSANATPYEINYLGCSMKIDNSNNSDFPAMQCIGGGLGSHGRITIKDCYFDAVLTTDYFRTSIGCVTYHNNRVDNTSKSLLIVSGNYFKISTFSLMWYGVSTLITRCLLSNNSFDCQFLHKAANAEATIENTDLVSWNNEIRN